MQRLEITPLGGIGEFGMNCMAVRYADEMILIDVGMGFPEETAYGVDISIPNFDFLEQYRDELTAVILTHGHEDHIGALAYLLKKFNLPVYSSEFTLALAEKRLDELDMLDDVLMHRVEAGETRQIGSFSVEFIHTTHSLVDCFILAITTPVGTIIHTGDYKLDNTPVIGKPFDLDSLKRYGDQGVLALLADSTNATVPGRTPSEKEVIPAFEELFDEAPGRIFVSTFSSSLHRLQIVFDIAHQFGRKVCVLGRSMMRNVEIGEELGLLTIFNETLVSLSESRSLDDDEVVYLVTGSQGEVRAALWNLATSVYKGLEIGRGDTVVLSARIIPGNEKQISRLIGSLYKRGANIIEEKRRLIHVSGHASQEDIKIMVETVRPRYLIPIHGEYRMLFRHKEFVKNHIAGYSDKNIILIEDGDVLEIDDFGARIIQSNELNRAFIDEESLTEIDYEIIRERKKLAYGGIVNILLNFDGRRDLLADQTKIEFQGVPTGEGLAELNSLIRHEIETTIGKLKPESISDTAVLREHTRIAVKRFLQKTLGVKPVIAITINDRQ